MRKLVHFSGGALLVVATLASTPASAPAQGPLQGQAQAITNATGGQWGAMAWSIKTGETLFAINADEPRIPASNNKVFSAIWALDALGPDYRFPTDMLITGPIANGVVRGDVVIRGSGDPAFGYPEYERDPMRPVRVMAQQLKARGVLVVEGGVMGDASIFGDSLIGPAWPQDTQGGASYYAPRVSGLPFQRNLLWITVRPEGGRVVTSESPAGTGIPVVVQARVGGGRALATRRPNGDTILIRGQVARQGRYGVGVANPALLAPAALREALIAEGIEVRGPVQVGKTPDNATLLHQHFSMTLGEMMPKLNRDSDNFFAEHVFKAAAAKALGQGTYEKAGEASATFYVRTAHAPNGQLYQADGSGLSALNRTSAKALVAAMVYARRQPWSNTFHESLAIAGDRRGSMRSLFVGTPAAGKLHAKTGYIRNVRTLSGYVPTAGGDTVVFSFLYNGSNTSGARGAQIHRGNLLVNYAGR
ncbi:hypothetical protein BH20GEM3_BH20GEM3_13560 [soil metagenome]